MRLASCLTSQPSQGFIEHVTPYTSSRQRATQITTLLDNEWDNDDKYSTDDDDDDDDNDDDAHLDYFRNIDIKITAFPLFRMLFARTVNKTLKHHGMSWQL